MRKYIYVLGLLLSLMVSAQNAEWHYTDESFKPGTRISDHLQTDSHIYVGGMIWDSQPYQPFLKKFDDSGNLVWSTVDHDEEEYDFPYFYSNGYDLVGVYKIFHTDNEPYIYTIWSSTDADHEVWKIDVETGEIVLRYYISNPHDFSSIENYNKDFFLVRFDGQFGLMLKDNGQLYNLSVLPFNAYNYDAFAIDDFGDIYLVDYLGNGGQVLKIDGASLLNGGTPETLWAWAFDEYDEGFEILRLQNIHLDLEHNNVYIFGKEDGVINGKPAIYILNAETGEVETKLDFPSEAYISSGFLDAVVQGDQLYTFWKSDNPPPYYVDFDQDYDYYFVTVDRLSQTKKAEFILKMDSTYIHTYPKNFIVNDNIVYISTEICDTIINSFCQKTWGLTKVDMDAEEVLFEKLVLLDTLADSRSRSISNPIFEINNKLFLLGEWQLAYGSRWYSNLAQIDKNTGAVSKSTNLGGKYKLPTELIQSAKLNGSNRVAFLRKEGLTISLELRESNDEILWTKTFHNGFYVRDAYLEITEGNKINIAYSNHSNDYYNEEPFYEYDLKNIQMYQYDEQGTLLKEAIFEEEDLENNEVYNMCPLKIIDDGDAWYLLYHLCAIGHRDLFISALKTNETTTLNTGFNINQGYVDYDKYMDHLDNIILDNGNEILFFGDSKTARFNKENMQITESIFQDTLSFTHVSHINNGQILATGVIRGPNGLNISTSQFISLLSAETLLPLSINDIKTDDFYIKPCIDKNEEYVYMLGYYFDNRAAIKKISIADGSVEWTRYTGAGMPLNATPEAITYNAYNDQIIVCGSYDENNVNTGIFIDIFDVHGNNLYAQIIKGSEIVEDPDITLIENKAITITTLDDGGFYIGGTIYNKEQDPESDYNIGFLYKYDGDFLRNSIKGKIFWDANNNGTFDDDEQIVDVGQLEIDDKFEAYVLDGKFNLALPYGQHSLHYRHDSCWTLTSNNAFTTVTVDSLSSDTIYYGIRPTVDKTKVELSIHHSIMRCHEEAYCWLKLENTGTEICNGNLVFHLPTFTEFVSAEPITGETFYSSYENLLPGSHQDIVIKLLLPGGQFLGNNINFDATLYAKDPMGEILDSSHYKNGLPLLCAYDPNDKLVRPTGIQEEGFTLFGEELSYTIRFQNTGNDTAFYVSLVDTLDSNLDLSTFKFTDASHELTSLTIRNNVATFEFENIILPDSTTNWLDSQGFVGFNIKAKENLPENTKIENKAGIIFGRNIPVITNTTLNTLVSELPTVGITELAPTEQFIQLSPNPFSDYFNIQFDEKINFPVELNIYNIEGKLIRQQQCHSATSRISSTNWQSGIYHLEFKDFSGEVFRYKVVRVE